MTSPTLEHDANNLAGPSHQPAMPPGSAVETTLQASQQGPSGVVIARDVTSLIDLPDAWLLQLASRLAPDACLAVFQTCREMRSLMLSQRRRVRTQFQLPLSPPAAAAAQAALQRACQQCLAVGLMCRGPKAGGRHGNTDSARNLLTRTMSSLGQPLLAISSVELKSLSLDGLVPTWLRSACPNMTSLTLDACSDGMLPAATTSIPACGQLQELFLKDPPYIYNPVLLQWQHQFRSLTGLHRLSIDAGPLRQLEQWLESGSAVGAQITRLSCCLSNHRCGLPGQLPARFPNIIELNVPVWILEDRDMEVLLRIPSLKRLWFKSTQLEHSYASRPCVWTEVHFCIIEVEEIARWPLNGKPSLHARHLNADALVFVSLSPGLQATASAVAAIAACGGIQWGSVDQVALAFAGRRAPTDAFLAMSLSMLSGCSASRVTVAMGRFPKVTPSLLNTLAPHLASLPATDVTFDDCDWADQAACALLLPGLPAHVHTVHLMDITGTVELTEGQFTEICVHAYRAVAVQVSDISEDWQTGWQLRVKEAMRAAGHEHVTLMDGVA